MNKKMKPRNFKPGTVVKCALPQAQTKTQTWIAARHTGGIEYVKKMNINLDQDYTICFLTITKRLPDIAPHLMVFQAIECELSIVFDKVISYPVIRSKKEK